MFRRLVSPRAPLSRRVARRRKSRAGGLGPTREYRANAREESIKKLADALEKAGITFLPESSQGVGETDQFLEARYPVSPSGTPSALQVALD
jgi:hypothetical protein